MPTGYTAAIADGISFTNYAMGCARAFGALIEMRDEPSDAPIPEEFKPSTYHLEELQKAQKKLHNLCKMSFGEAEGRAMVAYNEASFCKAALKKLAPVAENFEIYSVGWLGDKPEDWTVMECKGAVLREVKTGPRKGQYRIIVKGTERTVYVTREDMKEFQK